MRLMDAIGRMRALLEMAGVGPPFAVGLSPKAMLLLRSEMADVPTRPVEMGHPLPEGAVAQVHGVDVYTVR